MLYLLYHRFIMSRKIRPVVTIAMIYRITSRGDMEEGEHQRYSNGRIIDTPAVSSSQLYPRANSVREESPDEQQCCRRSQPRCGIACAHSLGHRESVYAVEMEMQRIDGAVKIDNRATCSIRRFEVVAQKENTTNAESACKNLWNGPRDS